MPGIILMYMDVAAQGHPWPLRHLCFLHIANAAERGKRESGLPLRQSVSSKRPFLRQSEKGPFIPVVLRYYPPEHVRYRTAINLKSVEKGCFSLLRNFEVRFTQVLLWIAAVW
jgi:hypothetical protein